MSLMGMALGAYSDGDGEGPASVASPIDILQSNPELTPIYALIASPYDPDTAGLTTIYYATADFTSDPSDTPSSQAFTPNLIGVPVNLSNNLSLRAGTIIASGVTAGEIILTTADPNNRIDDLAGYLWDGRDVKVLIGFEGYTLAQFAEIFTGTAEGARWDRDEISVLLRSPRFTLERELQTTFYAGATVTATDISFTAPDTISSTSTDLSVFEVGRLIEVVSSASNDGLYTVGTTGATSLTVSTGTIVNESAGASITLRTKVEGGDEVRGKPKPLIYGQVRQFDPVLVDSTNLVYQAHDGSIQAVNALRDRGVDLAFDADYADYEALAAATIPGGEYGTCLAEGLVRLGASPSGIVTGDFQGDDSGSLGAGGYTSTAADIIRKIATTKGALTDPDGLDVGSFTDLNTTTSAVVGIATRLSRETIADVLDRVANSVGAFIDWTRNGRLKVQQLVNPTTATASDTITSIWQTFEGKNADIPATRVTVAYRRYWRTLTGEETGTALDDDVRLDYAEDLRTATEPDATIMTAHPSAGTYRVETLLDLETEAAAESVRLLALYKESRHEYTVTAWDKLFAYQLGDVITLQVPRYDLTAGKNFVVVGWTETPVFSAGNHQNAVELVLWGREN